MDIDTIRKQTEKAKQSMECAQRLEYLLGEIDKRDSELDAIKSELDTFKRQHEKDMQLLEQATKPEPTRIGIKKGKTKLTPKRVGRWSHLKWPTVHAMRGDYVIHKMTIHAISQKYSISFDTVKAIVTNQSEKWYLKEYQDVLIERGMANV